MWTVTSSGLILDLHPANERRRYKVTPSLIGWTQTQNQPCILRSELSDSTNLDQPQFVVTVSNWFLIKVEPWAFAIWALEQDQFHLTQTSWIKPGDHTMSADCETAHVIMCNKFELLMHGAWELLRYGQNQ